MDLLVATPLDEVVDHAGSVTAALVGGGMVALIVSMYLALLDDGDRGSIRARLKDATTAFRPPADQEPPPSTTSVLGSVELVRALAGPAETFFRRSRAMVALLVGAVLFVAAALVPLFETALVANHCGGTIVGAEPAPSPEASAAPTAPVAPAPKDGGGAADAKKDKNAKGSDDATIAETTVATPDAGYPKVFYPPDCADV